MSNDLKRTQRKLHGSYVAVAVLLVLIALAWAGDIITLQGQRTIYTATCTASWEGQRCTGKLLAGDRYRYLALRARGEVIFWVAGSPEPSGKLTDCEIVDGRNWRCKPGPLSDRSPTLQMKHGRPDLLSATGGRPVHRISKLTWMLLEAGLWFGDTADS